MFKRFFPFLEWIHELKNPDTIRKDVIAGLSVSFILIPQSMAYAQLAGLPIEVGLYTAFLPVIVAALFGSSPQMSTGPITIVSLMTATALAPIASSGTEGYIAYASLLAFFIALVYILIGCLRLGVIVDFLSNPVIVGFTNAASILTITSQLSKIFGVSYNKGGNFFIDKFLLLEAITQSTNIPTFICGISSILFLILVGKYFPKLPKVLFLLLFSITISYLIQYNAVYNGNIVGYIPSNLPSISFDFLSISLESLVFLDVLRLLLFGTIIGLVGFTQSISVAKFVSYSTKKTLYPNRELIGQGMANLTSSIFGGYGVAGSFSKTAVNLKAGSKTGFTSVVTGAMVGVTLIFFTPFIAYLPVATLAAIIIVAVSHMIRFKPLHNAWKVEKHDAIIGYITFFLTLLFTPNIEIGVLAGVLLSLIFFIYRSMRPKLIELGYYEEHIYRDIDLFGLKSHPNISVFRFDGVLYFANAGYFESCMMNSIHKKPKLKYIIIDLEWVNTIDSSAKEVLQNIILNLREQDIKVYLSGIRTKVFDKLHRSDFFKKVGDKNIFTHIDTALEKINKKSKGKIKLGSLESYKEDKKKTPELDTKILKKIKKI